MPSLVVPFRGAEGKSRLELPTTAARAALVRAMLADVVGACLAVGPTFVVTPDEAELGEAVRAGLDAAFAARGPGPVLVVNADLPCAQARDLLALAGAVPDGGLALTAAAEGTTNALALSSVDVFVPLYGPGSAARFAALATTRVVDSPNLMDDVDTVADLERLVGRLGAHTRSVPAALREAAAA